MPQLCYVFLFFVSGQCLFWKCFANKWLLFALLFQVVFAGFSSESLAQRIVDCKPKVVITSNAVKRGPKVISLKDIVDAALVESAKNGISVGKKIK